MLFQVRTHERDARYLRHLLASVELYWPPALGAVVLVLDATAADRECARGRDGVWNSAGDNGMVSVRS